MYTHMGAGARESYDAGAGSFSKLFMKYWKFAQIFGISQFESMRKN